MFSTVRRIIGLSLFGGIGLVVVVAWVTGFFRRVWDRASGLWNGFVVWLNAPISMDHVMALGGVLTVPILLLVIMLAITDR